MNATLVVMAAGIGSRFGEGIKQLTPVGPSGEIIMDYSIYDAMEAGFNKVVFIIRRDLEEEFKEVIGNRISRYVTVDYAYQELTDLPEGFALPQGRTKPWGTAQAVLAVRGKVQEPFMVINADDYYGKEGFRVVYDYMKEHMQGKEASKLCMAGFVLKNTLSENGGVTRGVCKADEAGNLLDVTETFEIRWEGDVLRAVDGNKQPLTLDPQDIVSMNIWGMNPGFLDMIQEGFPGFLKGLSPGDIKSEYLLPTVIDRCIKKGQASVKVLKSHDRWFGVTYKEDKPVVVKSVRELVDQGVYPNKIFQ